ncbi:flagellar assembly protein FlgT [Alkalimarinus alittae]|uniref:Flagellar assembly protein FlgT n=1 Tax=Alkalimarinus alittae TaxID=2961619 RepID=A0ABY6N094_9ALTE|nr:flagellar assembly protein FlgT [Alkalimarinus alittae]UZE95455.1 flagellar assembly protein FlgT [Alkalimarinus alittae]
MTIKTHVSSALFMAFLLCLSSATQAEWVQVTGRANIVDGQYELARKQAREDALQQAAIRLGARIEGRQEMSNGALTKDDVTVTTQAKANSVVVVDESVDDGVLSMVVNADMVKVSMQLCAPDKANGYKKEIAVLGFLVQNPIEANLGALNDVDRKLASYLREQLVGFDNLVVHESSQYRLYEEATNAPTTETTQRTLTKVVKYAQQMGVQFIVSGIVRDLSVLDEDAYGSSMWKSIKRNIGFADRKRRFAIEVFIHDGFSGSVVFQKRYELTDIWNADPNDKIGFASASFEKTKYGRAVASLLNDVAKEVNGSMRCQPFMTRITRTDGKTIHFASGASSGIRPGDQLAVYRTYRFYDSDLLAGTELTNAKAALTVSQVHPSFATGTISVDTGRLNIQPDDLLIAW